MLCCTCSEDQESSKRRAEDEKKKAELTAKIEEKINSILPEHKREKALARLKEVGHVGVKPCSLQSQSLHMHVSKGVSSGLTGVCGRVS